VEQGLNPLVDREILGGKIVAYQIQWFNGAWSGWYVPGINDLDWVVNTGSDDQQGQRLVWSYFYDHTHKYIIATN